MAYSFPVPPTFLSGAASTQNSRFLILHGHPRHSLLSPGRRCSVHFHLHCPARPTALSAVTTHPAAMLLHLQPPCLPHWSACLCNRTNTVLAAITSGSSSTDTMPCGLCHGSNRNLPPEKLLFVLALADFCALHTCSTCGMATVWMKYG